ncbi:hypothetical protein VP01_1065g14 [Puccinia sorghi]|uniref:Uncharacterized protein n=1 Tax=Puccinia sorghi TaxID=27349 RepID=A0A0L6VU27_9BASI|nr:hypothetical protein VP01_1065g14 [Puccinia sorghi]
MLSTTTTIETLQGHLTTLQSLVQSIEAIRCQTLPALINSLQPAIQNVRTTTPAELLNWKNHSSQLDDALNTLRQQAINSQLAMKYIHATAMNNPNLSSEEKNKAFHDTLLTKQAAFKSRSTLSRRAKATTTIGPTTIEKHVLDAERLKRKKLARLEKQHASFPQVSIPVNSLHDCIQRINRLDHDPEEHLIFVSENQLVVKDLMRTFLVFKRTPSSTTHLSHPIIERAFCFSLTESPTTTLQRSSFGLIRSINRCINHHINQYFKSDRHRNPSNIWLVCSLLASYKDFFRSELSVLPRGPKTRGMVPRHGSKDMMSQGFLTWRRWKVEPARLDKLVAADEQQPGCAEQVSHCGDALELTLMGGQWAKVAEMK